MFGKHYTMSITYLQMSRIVKFLKDINLYTKI